MGGAWVGGRGTGGTAVELERRGQGGVVIERLAHEPPNRFEGLGVEIRLEGLG